MNDQAFYPDLLLSQVAAVDLFCLAGFVWLADYRVVNAVHEHYGIEVTGIPREETARKIMAALRYLFPSWRHTYVFERNSCSPDRGWTVQVYREPK